MILKIKKIKAINFFPKQCVFRNKKRPKLPPPNSRPMCQWMS